MASITDKLWERIEPYVAAEGVELDDVEVLGGGQIVRVTLDAEGPMGVDTIADLSRGIGRLIDEDDPIKGSYTLEVSSPGLERKLTRARHYEKSIGRNVKVKTHREIEGTKNHRGVLKASDDDGFTVAVEDTDRIISYADVASARTVFEWGNNDRSGKDS